MLLAFTFGFSSTATGSTSVCGAASIGSTCVFNSFSDNECIDTFEAKTSAMTRFLFFF